MISNEKTIDNIVVEIMEIYNFCFDHFPILIYIELFKFKILKSWEVQIFFSVINDFKWKGHECRNCRTHQNLQPNSHAKKSFSIFLKPN
jgi:hypothetical protein